MSAAVEDGASAPEDDDEEIESINAVLAHNRQTPFSKGVNRRTTATPNPSGAGSNGNGQSWEFQCQYCNLMGHLQKDCHQRRKAGRLKQKTSFAVRIKNNEKQIKIDGFRQASPEIKSQINYNWTQQMKQAVLDQCQLQNENFNQDPNQGYTVQNKKPLKAEILI
jgi:hypothetical protein